MDRPDQCPGCGKPLNPSDTPGFLYCSMKCRDKHWQEERSKASVAAEVAKLLEQYERGGWKP